MLTVTTMFMTFLVGNSKTNIRKSVKEEGLHALSQMEFIIKNALYVEGACEPGMTTVSVVGLDNGITTYSTQTGKIASNSARLTSDAVTLTSLAFDCTGDVGNRQIVVRFTLDKDAPTLNTDANISESFEATINIRN